MNRKDFSDHFGLPINTEICFSDHRGVYKKGIEKQQLKNLKKSAEFLKRFLEPGEEVLLAAKAVSPFGLLEQWTLGWYLYVMKRCLLVFTNKRVLHIPTKSNYGPKDGMSQFFYGAIESYKASQFLGRALTLTYKSGKTEKFASIPGKGLNKIKNLLPSLMENASPVSSQERQHLCPRCATALEPDVYKCAKCFLEFKNMGDATKYSILIPGGGYIYTRQYFLALGDFFMELFLLVILIVGITGLISGKEGGETLVIFGVILVLEKLGTIYHARLAVREFIPLEKDVQPMKGHA